MTAAPVVELDAVGAAVEMSDDCSSLPQLAPRVTRLMATVAGAMRSRLCTEDLTEVEDPSSSRLLGNTNIRQDDGRVHITRMISARCPTGQISTCEPTSKMRSLGRLKNRLALSAPRLSTTNKCSRSGCIPGALPAMIDRLRSAGLCGAGRCVLRERLGCPWRDA